MERALIVAKFKEDVSWVDKMRAAFNVQVYSKDPQERDPQIARLPNVGRESHTYLHYIVTHYDKLPELCLFTQGSPFQHCPDFIERAMGLRNITSYTALSHQEALFDGFGYPQLSASPLSLDKLCLSEYFEKFLQAKPPPLFYARMNGLFAVPRQVILQRPREFYVGCRAALEGRDAKEQAQFLGLNSVEGHFFERLWYFIFTPNWMDLPERPLVPGMPAERLRLVLPIIEKWPEQVHQLGFLQASALLLSASEVLNSNPAAWTAFVS
ncbi:MAG: DUF3431 domain-containing protein [Oligoflexia bacterium]|nr:DUF3431 domain-containing protein [Oligoflexia bacterium]